LDGDIGIIGALAVVDETDYQPPTADDAVELHTLSLLRLLPV
jgi:hypothetical protein